MNIQSTRLKNPARTVRARSQDPSSAVAKEAKQLPPVTNLTQGDRFTGALAGAVIAGLGASTFNTLGPTGGVLALVGGGAAGSHLGRHVWTNMDGNIQCDGGGFRGAALGAAGIALGALALSPALGNYGGALGMVAAVGLGAALGSRVMVPTFTSMRGKAWRDHYAEQFQADAIQSNIYRGSMTMGAAGILDAAACLGVGAGIVLGGLGASAAGLKGFLALGVPPLVAGAGLGLASYGSVKLADGFLAKAEKLNAETQTYTDREMESIRYRAGYSGD